VSSEIYNVYYEVMQTLRSIEELNWALNIYSNIVRFGKGSKMADEEQKCMRVLEDFEEYEKCLDLYQIFKTQQTQEEPKIEQ
jgi:hypothetical protein